MGVNYRCPQGRVGTLFIRLKIYVYSYPYLVRGPIARTVGFDLWIYLKSEFRHGLNVRLLALLFHTLKLEKCSSRLS